MIGAGMALGRVLEQLTEAGPDAFDITLFNAAPRGNYTRIMPSPVLSGEKTYADIVAHDAAWCAAWGGAVLGQAVARIDRAAKTVTSAGVETPCDQLVIATGSAPFILPVPGKDLPGVVTSRDLKDTNATIAAAKPGARAVVIGGGDAGTWLRSVGGCASCGPALNYYLRADWPTEYRDDRQSRLVNERNHANI